jgi:hypothetical protein
MAVVYLKKKEAEMGRWVQLSKKHPDIADDNEVVNVMELGGAEGDQVVQGQHFFTTDDSGEARELAVFLRTAEPWKMTDAETLFRENLWKRVNDGYVHMRSFNFRLMKHVYVGRWDSHKSQFVTR